MDAASGELSDNVCELMTSPASFKAAVWKHSDFPESRHDKGEKVTDRRKVQTLHIDLFEQTVRFKVWLLFSKHNVFLQRF